MANVIVIRNATGLQSSRPQGPVSGGSRLEILHLPTDALERSVTGKTRPTSPPTVRTQQSR
jgi:hypothetical protein